MKFGRILFALLFLLLALSLVACDSEENKEGVPDSDVNISNVKYMPYEKYVGDIYLTEDEKEEILEILNGGKWINDLTNCAADYEFTWGKATVRYHSGCGTFTDITNGRALETSEDQETRINQILKESESGIGMEIIADLSIYLDNINFVSGVSQKDFCVVGGTVVMGSRGNHGFCAVVLPHHAVYSGGPGTDKGCFCHCKPVFILVWCSADYCGNHGCTCTLRGFISQS